MTAISLRKGRQIGPADHADALARRPVCIDAFCAEVFPRCDALLLPILPNQVPTLDDTDWGAPARGRPIGHQIIGRPCDDGTLFRLGAAFQAVTGWHSRRPPRRA